MDKDVNGEMNRAPYTEGRTSLLDPGHNCRAVKRASYASLLVDCANYYRALHEAIAKARHSIFVLGWDIDSRIELLRGSEAESNSLPSRFFDLIKRQAAEHPNLTIYLNCWDYSIFMAREREAFAKRHWYRHTPGNVYYCKDNVIPPGACHHQKIVVIDDEMAFSGGMDIAVNRWDQRQHFPNSCDRVDPGDIYNPNPPHRYGPYHDVQIVVAGEVVDVLATIVRERWRRVTGSDPVPIRHKLMGDSLPASWPESIEPDFRDVQTGVAVTEPQWRGNVAVRHSERLYLDMIASAEHFIYIENQYCTRKPIAEALSRRLREKPELRILIVSSRSSNGMMERKAMWHGRVLFRDILESGGAGERVALAYPISRLNGDEKSVHIHSKVMIVDDRYLRVGSANLNNRSMELDTECDLVIEAQAPRIRKKIAAIRDDLIREHTGREVSDIEGLIQGGAPPERFLDYISHSRQHLCKIDDEKYRHEPLAALAIRIADPRKSLLPEKFFVTFSKLWRPSLTILVIALLALAWRITPLSQYATPDKLIPLLEQIRNAPWAIPAAMGVYTVATLAFFPHMAMTAAIVVVFTPEQAFSIAMIGSLVSGAIGFFIGWSLGLKSMRALVGETAQRISGYAKKGGILGITLLRLLPIAPYTAVNLALGMLETRFVHFVAGTFLGTLPGTLIASFLGYSVLELWRDPKPKNFLAIGAGLIVWITIVAASHLTAQWWRKRKGMAVT